ncbi:MAG: YggT family protein [Candidatus Syntrophosphaera sp.]
MFISLIIGLLRIYSIIIIVRVLMSWFVQNPYQNRFYMFLIRITEPVLGPIRRIMPSMGLDLSPVVVIILIQIISSLLISLT